MKKAIIDSNACDRSPFCPAKRVCPVTAITQKSPYESYSVNEELCIGCNKCVRVCPMDAITMN